MIEVSSKINDIYNDRYHHSFNEIYLSQKLIIHQIYSNAVVYIFIVLEPAH